MSYRKMIAGVALAAGLAGGAIAAGAPSLVVGSTATAGAPMLCWDAKTNTFCQNTDPVRPPLGPTTTTTVPAGTAG
jgi:hypothetical protein